MGGGSVFRQVRSYWLGYLEIEVLARLTFGDFDGRLLVLSGSKRANSLGQAIPVSCGRTVLEIDERSEERRVGKECRL